MYKFLSSIVELIISIYAFIFLAQVSQVSTIETAREYVYEYKQSVGIILYPDVIVFDQIGSESQVEYLSQGSIVLFDQQNVLFDQTNLSGNDSNTEAAELKNGNESEWLHLTFPYDGWIAAKAVQTSPTAFISSYPLWNSLPELYSAGKEVLGTKRLSLGWTDQWPIGTGGIGTVLVLLLYFSVCI